MGYILASLGGLASLICLIMVLIKMFKTQESPLMGIIGIFCTIWAFIWGWMNAGKLGLKNIMLLWTVSIIVASIGYSIIIKDSINAIQSMEMKPTTITPMEMTPAEVAPPEEAAPEQ